MNSPLSSLRRLGARCRALFRRSSLERDMAAEMQAHLDLQTERHVAAGMPADEARYAAQRQFGNVASLQARAREQRGWFWLENAGRDLRHGGRQLLKAPGTTALAVLSLAVGIGVNSTLFSVMDAAFSRPLPIREPERIVKFERALFTAAEFEQVRAELPSLASLAASNRGQVMLRNDEGYELVVSRAVSANYFEVLGNTPAAGRFFGERSPDLREPIAVLSHALWQRRFGGDPAIVGKTITLRDRTVTVVGVAARGFTGEDRVPTTEVWYPYDSQPAAYSADRRAFRLTGRLLPDRDIGQLRAETAAVFARPEWRALGDRTPAGRVRVVTEEESRLDHGGRLTYFMAPVVGLVLLVACANVSCLLLGRYEERRREIAVRLALGASRGRVMSYLLTEGALLALLGGAAGLALTAWGIQAVPALLPPALATFAPAAQVDLRVLALTFGLAVVATLAFGLLPAWRASRADVAARLKSDGGRLGRTPARNVLVVAQVATAMLFLAVAGLFIRGFGKGLERDFGFSERNLLLAFVVPEGQPRQNFEPMLDDLRRTIDALPGVAAVTVANTAVGGNRPAAVRLTEADEAQTIRCNFIDPGFFGILGIPLRRGRDFDLHDNRSAGRVVIISEAMAHRFWPNEDPVGRTVLIDTKRCTVVGVAGDVSDLTERDPADQSFFYLPLRQEQRGEWMLIAKTVPPPAKLAAPVRDALRRLETPAAALLIDTIESRLRTTLMPQWFGAWLGGVLGGLAFVLAVTGLYGVVAYAVARRTRELGIRIALGAVPRDAIRLVLRQGLGLAALGTGVGLLLATGVGVLLSSLLQGISPVDPVALAGSAAVVLSVAALASYLPARRAAKVDPMDALRAE